MGKIQFQDLIGDAKGTLIYMIVENGPADWDITRTSKDATNSISTVIISSGHTSRDEAHQILWDIKQRNSIRILATKDKLAGEDREQDALSSALGSWIPPVEPDPEP